MSSKRAEVRRRELKDRSSGPPTTPQWLHDAWEGFNSTMDTLTYPRPDEGNMWNEEALRERGMSEEDISRWQEPQEPLLGIMTIDSPLRSVAYRTDILRKLEDQVNKLDDLDHREMFGWLIEKYPRLMAAFGHSGGKIQMDPEFLNMPEYAWATRGGQFNPPPAGSQQVQGLTEGVQMNPVINITPEKALLKAGRQIPLEDAYLIRKGRRYSGIPDTGDLGETAAHEATHWAQYLQGPGRKRVEDIRDDKKRGFADSLIRSDRLSQSKDALERGAEIAGVNQVKRRRIDQKRRERNARVRSENQLGYNARRPLLNFWPFN